MSDTSQGPGWWIASDGKWYSPEQQPGPVSPEPPAAAPEAPGPEAPAPEPSAPVTPPAVAPETPPPAAEPPTEPIPVTPPPMAPPPMAPPPLPPAPMGAPLLPPPGTPPPMMTPPAGGYAGAAPVAVAPAPPDKKGNGCLKAVLIVGGIVALLGIATFIALAFLLNKGVDTVNDKLDAQEKVEQRTGISSNSFNTEHPPQDDLDGDWKCSTSAGGFPQVTGTVKNNSSRASTYTITVEFKQNGTQFSTGSGVIVSVDPNQTADFSATGSVVPTGQFSCKIDSIDRFDTSNLDGN